MWIVTIGVNCMFAFDLESDGLPRMPISVEVDSETVNLIDGGDGTCHQSLSICERIIMLINTFYRSSVVYVGSLPVLFCRMETLA